MLPPSYDFDYEYDGEREEFKRAMDTGCPSFFAAFYDIHEGQFNLWFQWFCFVFSIVGIPSGVLLARLCNWMRSHRARTRENLQGVLVFISYRVVADKAHVEKLYDKLTDLGVEVWYDAGCLEPGKKWENDFVDALCRARVFVPVLSRDGLAAFAKLKADSPSDNVLLEHRLALELLERKKIDRIAPLLVCARDFFKEGGKPIFEDGSEAVEAVEAKVAAHLERLELGLPQVPPYLRGPKATLNALLVHQGESLRGDGRMAMRAAVSFVAESARLTGDGEDGVPTRWKSLLGMAMQEIFPFTLTACRSLRRRWYRMLLACWRGKDAMVDDQGLPHTVARPREQQQLLFSTGVHAPSEYFDTERVVNPILVHALPSPEGHRRPAGKSPLSRLLPDNKRSKPPCAIEMDLVNAHLGLAKSTKPGSSQDEDTLRDSAASHGEQDDGARARAGTITKAVQNARTSHAKRAQAPPRTNSDFGNAGDDANANAVDDTSLA